MILGEGLFIGNGEGGELNLTATDTLTASGQGSGLFTSTVANGNGGKMNVHVSRLDLRDGAVLSASARGSGNAGTVTVQGTGSPAESILIDGVGSGIFSDTQGTGAGGTIFVDANSVTLQNSAQVTSSSTGTGTGPGRAGDITINAGNQFAMTNSSVTTEANQSGGGAIKINTNPSGTVELTDSTISASVLDGTGGGGSVNIDPEFVILQNSQILANAVFGPGGNISITTNALVQDATSLVDASSQFGVSGTVRVQSPNAPAAGKIVPLSKSPLPATALLGERCAAVEGGLYSSFVVAGHYGVPTEPGGWLASPLVALSADAGLEAGGERQEGTYAVSSLRNVTEILSLRGLPASDTVANILLMDWTAGCGS